VSGDHVVYKSEGWMHKEATPVEDSLGRRVRGCIGTWATAKGVPRSGVGCTDL